MSFLKIFIASQNNKILLDLDFWLRMYKPYILKYSDIKMSLKKYFVSSFLYEEKIHKSVLRGGYGELTKKYIFLFLLNAPHTMPD